MFNHQNIFRQKCDARNAQSFAEYIAILKLIKNAGVKHSEIIKIVNIAYFKFAVEKPELFKKNLHELFEVDDLHERTMQGLRFWDEKELPW